MKPSQARLQKGLTLLEVLLASFILLVILGVISGGIISSSRAVGTIIAESELIEDIRVAGQMITDRASRALYMYPPGATLTLNSVTLRTVKNPRDNSNVWRVGVDPILAFLEAPEETTNKECRPADSSKSPNSEECIHFVAYYPVKRSVYTSDGTYTYLKDDNNPDAWVLMEYRSRLDIETLTTKQPIDTRFGGIQAHMLADYILVNEGFAVLRDTMRCQRQWEDAITEKNCDELAVNYEPNANNNLAAAEIELQASFNKRNGVSQTPRMTFSVAPRNLYILVD